VAASAGKIMLQKLGLYDVLANLIPGLAFVSALDWLAEYFGQPKVLGGSGSIGDASILIAWAYIIGLLLQGIGQSIVEKIALKLTGGFPSAKLLIDGREGFTQEHRTKLKEAVQAYFGEPVEPVVPTNSGPNKALELRLRRYQEVFYLCYNLVDQKNLSDRPLSFNAHYGLFRSVLTFSIILFLVFGVALASGWNEVSQRGSSVLFGCILSSFFAASLVSYHRMKKRGEDFAKSVYDLFFTFYRQGMIHNR
jgi:hypothetical protein